MATRGSGRVRNRMREIFQRIGGPLTERTLTEVLIIGQGYASAMTPVATSNLINSQYRIVERLPAGWKGRVGYTAAYAAAVHDAPGTLMGQPRPDGSGDYWAPDGEPRFLRKGFEVEGRAEIEAAIARGMKI